MASRTIENRKSRLITMLINPLMSCSARLPIYLLLVGALFPEQCEFGVVKYLCDRNFSGCAVGASVQQVFGKG